MKTQMFNVAAALALTLIAAGQCGAQQGSLRVNVPFAFTVGDKAMPAGEYRVAELSRVQQTVQVIAQSDGDASIMVMTNAVVRPGKVPTPRLTFHHYGNRYFLAEIWTGDARGRQLVKPHGENELATTLSMQEVAVLASSSSNKL
ncbi:MAG TPA: hypothetical protein VN881_03750 [Candidatus Acidoferrales bacterium]|nr:hypothetical protein [Candidatus Acidoferrales bacterium]